MLVFSFSYLVISLVISQPTQKVFTGTIYSLQMLLSYLLSYIHYITLVLQILIQSVCETLVPKLVAEDIPLLQSLLSDVFPGIQYKGADVSFCFWITHFNLNF